MNPKNMGPILINTNYEKLSNPNPKPRNHSNYFSISFRGELFISIDSKIVSYLSINQYAHLRR
jgi:hypothetical protein